MEAVATARTGAWVPYSAPLVVAAVWIVDGPGAVKRDEARQGGAEEEDAGTALKGDDGARAQTQTQAAVRSGRDSHSRVGVSPRAGSRAQRQRRRG